MTVLFQPNVQFVGSGSEYFRIWIVNLLLTLVTLGFYYPYAKVRRLRYFHGATELGGQPLSFHGEPIKMLRGYLLVGFLFLAYSGAEQFSPGVGTVAFALIALMLPVLWHSSLRFRMANTGWRGMRLQFRGTRANAYRALAAGIVAVLVIPAVALLGIAAPAELTSDAQPTGMGLLNGAVLLVPLLMLLGFPALRWLMQRYQQGHFALGDEQTRFEVPLRRFYSLALKAFGLLMLVSLLILAGVGAAVAAGSLAINAEEIKLGKLPPELLPLLGLLPVLLLLAYSLILAPYLATRMQNLVWNSTQSRNLRFESTLRVRQMIALSLLNGLLIIVTLGLYSPFAAAAKAR